jgi:hypothetical protein
MLLSTLLTAVRANLAADLGPEWLVDAAADEFAALDLLAMTGIRNRVVAMAGALVPLGDGELEGLGCRHTLTLVIQVPRGMKMDPAGDCETRLLDAEETVRRLMLAYQFTHAAEAGPHATAGPFRHAGSEAVPDALDNPARSLRFTHELVLAMPDEARPVVLDSY